MLKWVDMVLSYYGEGGFRLQSGDLALLVDPPSARFKAEVILRTTAWATGYLPQPGEIFTPGEYEVKGIEILGWQIDSESTDKNVKTIYRVRWENIHFAFLGQLKKTPPIEIIENLDGALDVLVLGVGGGEGLGAKEALNIVKQLEPAVIVPSFFKDPTEFIKLTGKKVEAQEKFVFKKKDLEGRIGEVVWLEKRET
ncbi:MAG: MBL fold metallo-hydrolase [Candidatus Liptonbacteria bacterium]|nr:MBL fold metallo-hydrolase [Candidatus Liptonbacteria bacterium]